MKQVRNPVRPFLPTATGCGVGRSVFFFYISLHTFNIWLGVQCSVETEISEIYDQVKSLYDKVKYLSYALYIYIYIYIYTHTHTHIHIYVHTFIHIFMHIVNKTEIQIEFTSGFSIYRNVEYGPGPWATITVLTKLETSHTVLTKLVF